jgi:pyruvate-formate lyase-activating enzyme
MGQLLYFDLNKACNSQCLFCASDSGLFPPSDMSIESVLAAMNQYGLAEGDTVLFCGGEPTLYPSLLTAVRAARKHVAFVYLFTNGRRAAQSKYAAELVTAGITRFSIPLYGPSPTVHDAIVGVPGSFSQTLDAIRNLQVIRSQYPCPIEIELKLLHCKATLDLNPFLVDFIADELGPIDRLVVSGLFLSSTALSNKDAVFIRFEESITSLNALLKTILWRGLPLVVYYIPLCMLCDEVIAYALDPKPGMQALDWSRSQNFLDYPHPYIYFSYEIPQGTRLLRQGAFDENTTQGTKHPVCASCAAQQMCLIDVQYARSMEFTAFKPLGTAEYVAGAGVRV